MWDRRKLLIVVAAVALGGCEPQPPAEQAAADGPLPEPPSQEVPEAHVVAFNRAVEAALDMRYEAAATEFTRLIKVFEELGAGQRSAEATFWLGYCYEKLGQTEQAKVVYSRLLLKYPRGTPAEQAAFRLDRMGVSVQ